MKKPGRNDPCYCGSGKKYKQCHLRIDMEAERNERELHNAARFLRRELPRFAREERFVDEFNKAMPIYWNELYDSDTMSEMSEFEALRFLDWFALDYVLPSGERVAEIYRSEHGDELESAQLETLEAWLASAPFWAYELTDYEGQILSLRDFTSGEMHEVFEPGGRGNVEIGEVILARLVPVHDHLEFSTLAAYLPAGEFDGLAAQLAEARATFTEEHADADEAEIRRHTNYLLIHHGLAAAEAAGRPPVARLDPHRDDPPARHLLGHEHEKERVHRQRTYGATQPHDTQIRRKAIG